MTGGILEFRRHFADIWNDQWKLINADLICPIRYLRSACRPYKTRCCTLGKSVRADAPTFEPLWTSEPGRCAGEVESGFILEPSDSESSGL